MAVMTVSSLCCGIGWWVSHRPRYQRGDNSGSTEVREGQSVTGIDEERSLSANQQVHSTLL